jgi:8-oxo-dGTP diphosphatase
MKRVADCFVEENGRVLLVKASYRDYWQFPGGHAEDGETPYQTAAREVREEVGAGIRVTRLLVLNTETDVQGQADTFCFLFAGTYDEQAPIVLQADEVAEFAWVPIDEAAIRLHPLVRPLLPHARGALEEGNTVYLEDGQIIK